MPLPNVMSLLKKTIDSTKYTILIKEGKVMNAVNYVLDYKLWEGKWELYEGFPVAMACTYD